MRSPRHPESDDDTVVLGDLRLCRTTLDALPDPVAVLDGGGRLLHLSPRWSLLTGLPASAFPAGPGLDDLPEVHAVREAFRQAVLEDRDTVGFHTRYLGRHGLETVISTEMRLVYSGSDYVGHISAYREAPTVTAPADTVGVPAGGDTGADLGEVPPSEAGTTRSPQVDGLRTSSRFLSLLSHELRTPLTSISAYAQLLAESPAADGGGAAVRVQRAAGRLTGLVDQLLDLAQADAVRSSAHAVDLSRALVDAEAAVAAQGLPVAVTPEIPPRIRAFADPTLVSRVLANLLANAARFAPGPVTVRVAGRDGRWRVQVIDVGDGFPPAPDDETWFEPFVRAGEGAGAGLGLAIVRSFVHSMDGSCGIERTPAGSVVWFELPAYRGTRGGAPDTDPAEATPSTSTTPTPRRRGARVVCVEDDEMNGAVLVAALAVTGADVVVTRTARDGIGAITTAPTDLIILDLDLPDMHGLDLLRSLGATRATSGVPVLVVTADGSHAARNAALAAGAARFMSKPYDLDALRSAVRSLTAPPDPAAGGDA
jgi:CheY-like chemotaxis protein